MAPRRNCSGNNDKVLRPGILPLLKIFKATGQDYSKESKGSSCNVPPQDTGTSSILEFSAPWLEKTQKLVSDALQKVDFLHARTEESVLLSHQKESSSSNGLQDILRALPPLERRMLSFVSQHPLNKGQTFMCIDAEMLQRKFFETGLWLGLFLLTNTKETANLVPALLDGRQMRTRVYSSAYARLQGEPGILCPNNSYDTGPGLEDQESEDSSRMHPIKLIPRMSMMALGELIQRQALFQKQQAFPDKEMLDSVQDFFVYTEFEGKRTFDQIDADADGKVTLNDLKGAMSKMNLPICYAETFMRGKLKFWPAKSFGWLEFSSIVQEKEPVIVKLFNSLGVSKSAKLQREHLKDSLRKAGLPATETNVTSMMRFLGADGDGSIKYGRFREFMMLIPTDDLHLNPWSVWLKAATTDGLDLYADCLPTSVFDHVATLSKALPICSMQRRWETK